MFGFTKSKLKSYLFKDNEETVLKICEIMFSFSSVRMMSFFRYLLYVINDLFRKTLSNFVQFWASVDTLKLFGSDE